MGFDQTAYLSELASKKSKMRGISEQKVDSYKNKEIKGMNMQFESELEEESRLLREKLESELNRKVSEERIRQEKRLTKEKDQLDEEMKLRSESKL